MFTHDFSGASVLVLGDVMLDQYYSGRVERISPEAPVPVVRILSDKSVLGGAGNAANNVSQLKAEVFLLGLVGRDRNQLEIRRMLKENNIQQLLIEGEIPTTAKIRVIGGNQQITRLDFEEECKMTDRLFESICKNISHAGEKVSAFIISDYGKGFCSPEVCQYAIDYAVAHGKPILVDPKGSDWNKYRNATLITPNVKELGEVAGRPVKNEDAEIERYGVMVMRQYHLRHLLVTRSEKGMSLISEEGTHHFPTEAKEVYDVSGAGDTVIATLAAALAGKCDLMTAIRLSNKAAGIVVGKAGTVPIHFRDLTAPREASPENKIISMQNIAQVVENIRKEGKRIVFTNGCFDFLHRGHVSCLREAKDRGDVLIVGLNSDTSVKRLKGEGRPVNDQTDRAIVLSSLEFVDHVVIFGEDTPYNLIRLIRPDVLVKGGDYKPENIVGREFAGQTVALGFMEGYSTTQTIRLIKGSGIG